MEVLSKNGRKVFDVNEFVESIESDDLVYAYADYIELTATLFIDSEPFHLIYLGGLKEARHMEYLLKQLGVTFKPNYEDFGRRTTIRISSKLKQELNKYKKNTCTYEDVIWGLIGNQMEE